MAACATLGLMMHKEAAAAAALPARTSRRDDDMHNSEVGRVTEDDAGAKLSTKQGEKETNVANVMKKQENLNIVFMMAMIYCTNATRRISPCLMK
mmetsp:Transcript_5098/g.11100  ORF Transcript_5098/g.11100 Transcript_5098/m.11100 type:complete len:95 (-) Transcript_5098:2-286(-)